MGKIEVSINPNVVKTMSKSAIALRTRRVDQPAVPLSFSAMKNARFGAVVPLTSFSRSRKGCKMGPLANCR